MPDMHGLTAVAIGGGTGLPVTIRALLDRGFATSAVVAMSDDGGSTGILRECVGAIPPGDIRNCLVAMAAHPEAPFVRAFQHRLEYAQNHALGNLILTVLTEEAGSFPEAVAICGRLLEARGRVYPSTVEDIVLCGCTRDGREQRGQASLGNGECALNRVWLDPTDPRAYGPALDAIRSSDLIVLGPGSLFTSIIPNLLIPGVVDAIRESDAITVFVCSLADMQGETWGLDVFEHVDALLDHGMRDLLDVVLVHRSESDRRSHGMVTEQFERVAGGAAAHESKRLDGDIRRVSVSSELLDRIEKSGVAAVARNLADPLRPTWHSVELLGAAIEEVLSSCRSQQK